MVFHVPVVTAAAVPEYCAPARAVGTPARGLFSSDTGAPALMPGRLVISAAVSDSRIRRLAFVYMRSPYLAALVTSSVGVSGRRIKSILEPLNRITERLRARAPVRLLRM